VPESGKKETDAQSLRDIFQVVKCSDVKLDSFVRLGKPGVKARLIKVHLESVNDKHKILSGTKYLREKRDHEYAHGWSKVFLTLGPNKGRKIEEY
jgi:hypothetical protein